MSLYKTLFMHEQDHLISRYNELIEAVVYSLVAFLVPFLIGHPQYVTGIIVNMALVLAALNLRNEKLLPVIFLPSIATLSRGIIFGPFTMYLVYMIPFIWVGNLLMVYSIRRLKTPSRKGLLAALGVGALAKSGFLLGSAYLLFRLGIIPSQLLTPMGGVQLATAAIGGSLALGIHSLRRRLTSAGMQPKI